MTELVEIDNNEDNVSSPIEREMWTTPDNFATDDNDIHLIRTKGNYINNYISAMFYGYFGLVCTMCCCFFALGCAIFTFLMSLWVCGFFGVMGLYGVWKSRLRFPYVDEKEEKVGVMELSIFDARLPSFVKIFTTSRKHVIKFRDIRRIVIEERNEASEFMNYSVIVQKKTRKLEKPDARLDIKDKNKVIQGNIAVPKGETVMVYFTGRDEAVKWGRRLKSFFEEKSEDLADIEFIMTRKTTTEWKPREKKGDTITRFYEVEKWLKDMTLED